MPALKEHELESLEIELLLEAIFRRSGFDFREYASGSLRRRIRHSMREEGLETVSALQNKLLHDPACMQRFLLVMSIDVTGMFSLSDCQWSPSSVE